MARRSGVVALLALAVAAGAVVLGIRWRDRLVTHPRPEISEPARALVPAQPPAGVADDAATGPLADALGESIDRLRLAPGRALVFGPDTVLASDVARQLDEVRSLVRSGLGGAALVQQLLTRYRAYGSAAGPGGVLVTGYYQSTLEVSRKRGGPYQTPLYRLPPQLVTVDLGLFSEDWSGKRLAGLLGAGRLLPVPDRASIAAGALDGQGLELLWANDEIEAFFLEIQGSARARLEDGSVVQVGYAGSNGRPYRAVGKLLIDEGKVPREKMSMQAIRAYLREHPEDRRRVMDYNPSVVFFELKARGPEGSSGAVVTGGRSIATDRQLFPVGALALLQTTQPVLDAAGDRVGAEPLVRLVLNQDTGGAIRGAGRVDLFTGAGREAEGLAGHLKDAGSLFFLSPLPPVPR